MIRISKLSTTLTNKGKHNKLILFIEQYKEVVQHYINIIWDNLNDKLETPKFISNTDYSHPTLSQRVVKCASTQACGMIKAVTEKKRKLLWLINKFKHNPNNDISYFEKKLSEIKISKPKLPNKFKCELNSICCDLLQRNGIWFLQLKSIGKEFGKIRIPIKPHRQTNKWKEIGVILNSFLISERYINIRFEIKSELKTVGRKVGLDQGINSCISLSDGQVSKDQFNRKIIDNEDGHGWNLNKILDKLSRRKKGSKGFARIQELRKNYINWSVNRLNLDGIKEIGVEKVKDLRKGKNVSRFMSGWTYAIILDKLKRYCEEQKVFVNEQCSTYRSQRCYACGLVLKKQRKGKLYSCRCGYSNDADLNAALNHECELPDVSFLRHLKLNIGGFYWLESGIFDLGGNEFTVCCASGKVKIIHFN